jgi:hypothetical protein
MLNAKRILRTHQQLVRRVHKTVVLKTVWQTLRFASKIPSPTPSKNQQPSGIGKTILRTTVSYNMAQIL